MTEDNVTLGSTQTNILNGQPFEPVGSPTVSIESVIATLPTGAGRRRRAVEAQPLLRAPRRLVRRARRREEPVPRPGGRPALRAAQPDRRPRGAAQPGRQRRADAPAMRSVLDSAARRQAQRAAAAQSGRLIRDPAGIRRWGSVRQVGGYRARSCSWAAASIPTALTSAWRSPRTRMRPSVRAVAGSKSPACIASASS